MVLTGVMSCKTQEKFDSILRRLRGLPVDISTYDFDITVDYESQDTQTDREINEIIAMLLDIIESVEEHGISRFGEKR